MSKYNIEGNIDFFNELYKSLDDGDEEFPDDNNICLITKQPLEDKFVELECGHKFNYIPLFNDIKNHKQKFNCMEGGNSKLKLNEIRCPYCRNKQEGVLPYYEELYIKKVNGVNFYDPSLNIVCINAPKYQNCEYLTPNPAFDPEGKNPIEKATKYSGKNCKFFTCYHGGHYKISQIIPNFNGELMLCYSHKNKTVKSYNIEIKNMTKTKVKEEKQKAKEEAKQKAKDEKQKAKDEKQKAKDEKQKAKGVKPVKKFKNNENEIIGSVTIQYSLNNNLDASNNILDEGCIEILKTGSKKGLKCGAKKHDEYRCKRHIKLLIDKPSTEETTPQILSQLDPQNNS